MAHANIITGELRKKVGALVGSKWKGISYVRAYQKSVKDANTPAQQNIRNQFKMVTQFGSGINEAVLKPFQAKPVKNQSAYNHFVQINRDVINDKSKGYESIKIFDGTLPVASGFQAAVSEAAETVEVSFTPLQYGLCEETDILIAVVYNESKNTYGFNIIERGGGNEPLSLSVPAYFVRDDILHVYLTACQSGKNNGGTLAVTITVGA